MTARFFVPTTRLAPGQALALPPGVARHVQVLRLQPGDEVILFNGEGGEWTAGITRMGRSDVDVEMRTHRPGTPAPATPVTLTVGIPANDRFDWLIEKATELGVGRIQPLLCARSVFRLSGERAERKLAHWHGIAVAAAEQCGATGVPAIDPIRTLKEVAELRRRADTPAAERWILSLSDSLPLAARWRARATGGATHLPLEVFSGPEGGWTSDEEALLRACGALPTSLGPRVLRAETAPLTVLSWIALHAPTPPAVPSGADADPPCSA